MRIVMVTPWFPSNVNRVSGVFVARDAALLAAEDDVHVVHLVDPGLLADDDERRFTVDGYSVERIPWGRRSLRDVRVVRRRLASALTRADVLHTHAFSALLPLTGMRIRRPWVHSEHWSGIGNPASLSPRGRLVVRLTGGALRRPDVVTAVSTFLADRVRAFRAGPIAIIPSVVSPPPSLVAPPGDAGMIRLVSVGNVVDGKDPLLAVAAVRELRARGHEVVLRWVGDGPLLGTVHSVVGDDPGIRFDGADDAHGVARALDDADVFLLPTRGETLCLSALEAISHGRPVVIGANGGQRDYVTADNGRLVAERSATAYADAVADLWASRGSRTPESIAATIGDRFTPTAVAAAYRAAYREAIARRR